MGSHCDQHNTGRSINPNTPTASFEARGEFRCHCAKGDNGNGDPNSIEKQEKPPDNGIPLKRYVGKKARKQRRSAGAQYKRKQESI